MEKDSTADWLKEMRKGYIRLIVLTLLSKKPHHGYEIMKEVKEKTGGAIKLTSGGVYRILSDLEESKYIQGEWDSQNHRKRKTYKITETGIEILERALTKENQLANNMHGLFREYLTGVLDIELPPSQPLKTPNLFAMYLDQRPAEPEDSIEVLKEKEAELQAMIRKLQKIQKTIRKRITDV